MIRFINGKEETYRLLFKSVVICSFCFLVCCNKRINTKETSFFNVSSIAITKSSDSVFFYEPLNCYLTIKEDPYEIHNINERIRHLSEYIYESSDSIDNKPIFEDKKPSHRAIKIIPQTIQEYERLINDSTIMVSPIPFGCSIVGGETRLKNVENFTNESYSDDMIPCCIDSPNGKERPFNPYPLYLTLPINDSLPEGSELLYDVYIPSDNTCLDTLLSASIAGLINDSIREPIDLNDIKQRVRRMWSGTFSSYDEVLGTYVPLKYIEVLIANGAATTKYTTNNTGQLSFPISVPTSANIIIGLRNSTFTINADSVFSYLLLGTLQSFKNSSPAFTYTVQCPYHFRYQVYNAAAYYFYSSNLIFNIMDRINEVISGPFVINAFSHDGDKAGYFKMSSSPFINVWEYYLTGPHRASYNTCTVLHELGHATHYATNGLYGMAASDNYVKESFASFFSWYCMKDYYSSVLDSTQTINDICHQGRQSWQLSSNSCYTPFYVDLYDTYNQHSDNYLNVDDNISISLLVVRNSALGCNSLQGSYDYLQNFYNVYNPSLYDPSHMATMVSYYGNLISTD